MIKEFLNYRYYVIIAVFTMSAIMIFSEGNDEVSLLVDLAVKALGFGIGKLGIVLYQYWMKRENLVLFKKLEDMCDE